MDVKITKMKNKRSQITIFIIIALIIVASIALVFLFSKSQATINPEQNPQGYIEQCMHESLLNAEKIIIDGNGYINKTENYIIYSINKPKEKVPYLCKSAQFYVPCVNQEPMFINYISKEIESLVKPDTEKCFANMITIFKKNNYEIIEGELNLSVSFTGKYISIDADKSIIMSKLDETKSYKNFNSEIQSPIYRLVDTARNIVNYESTLCEFNIKSWTDVYRDVSIKLFRTSDQSKVYTLKDKSTEKYISFALKTCILPAGI